jgi:hypothetical protein
MSVGFFDERFFISEFDGPIEATGGVNRSLFRGLRSEGIYGLASGARGGR